MDSETGESLRDKETGEMPPSAKINIETGEAEINHSKPQQENVPKKFKILNKKLKCQTSKKRKKLSNIDNPNVFNMHDFAQCVLFLLPTTLLFYPVMGQFIVILEILLHIWAHKKNKKSSNKNIYYQSPLHLYMRQFCGACQEEIASSKITSMQDKRNYKFIKYGIDYVQGIVM